MAPVALMDEEMELEPIGSQSDRKASLSYNNPDVLSVNQLLESVILIFNLKFASFHDNNVF